MRLAWLSSLGICACATLADTGGGDVALPNALVGPFREITSDELGENRVAPYALNDDEAFLRDATVIDADGDVASPEAYVYAAAQAAVEGVEPAIAPPDRILRFVAADGRSPARQFDEVLVAEADWEAGTIGAPSAIRVGSEIWLFYAGGGGIGLAKSGDGSTFTRAGQVLGARGDGWDRGAIPESPAVVALADGTFHLFYEVEVEGASMIGEAQSGDGITWTRAEAPALVGASGPCALIARSAEGRVIEYLYHAGEGDAGRAILLAARYDAMGSFALAEAPVFANDLVIGEPWVTRRATYSLLFVTQLAGDTPALERPAVAVGVAPATITLP